MNGIEYLAIARDAAITIAGARPRLSSASALESLCHANTAVTPTLLIDPALKQSNGMKEKQPQILRLTTPKLKNVWGPVRSG